MSRHLVLRFDAPLLAFGGTMVDARGVTDDHPGTSLLTGLLGNALGYDHRDASALARLQARLRHAARADRPGTPVVDFQTVDLGQPHLVGTGWTTRGIVEGREGAFSEGTHIRHRHYLADAVFTVVLTVAPADESPTLDDLAMALRAPERPLFLGRKACLPAGPVLAGWVEADDLRGALLAVPALPRGDARPAPTETMLWTPATAPSGDGRVRRTRDLRDWQNQVHAGYRYVHVETVPTASLPGAADER